VVIVMSAALDSDPMTLAGLMRVAGVFVPSSLAAAIVCWFLSQGLMRLLWAAELGH